MDSFTIGPFTATEIEKVVKKLEEQGISFHLTRDESVEASKMKSDQASILRTEFRTDVFLDQAYFVAITPEDKELVETLIGPILGAPHLEGTSAELVETARSKFEDRIWQKEVADRKAKEKALLRRIVWPLLLLVLALLIYQNFLKTPPGF